MSSGDEKVCATVRSALESHKVDFQETEIQNATKFTAKSSAQVASINVYNTGRMNVEEKQTDLKKWMSDLKESVEKGSGGPVTLLPAEIENFRKHYGYEFQNVMT